MAGGAAASPGMSRFPRRRRASELEDQFRAIGTPVSRRHEVAAELGRHRAVLEVFGVEQIIDVGIERDIASLDAQPRVDRRKGRSEEHTSELQSLMRISYA